MYLFYYLCRHRKTTVIINIIIIIVYCIFQQLLEQTGETDDESYFNESTNSLVSILLVKTKTYIPLLRHTPNLC